LVKSNARWRLLGGGLAALSKASTESLGVTLNDHWLEWRHLLFVLSLGNVGRRRGHAVLVVDAHVLGLVLRCHCSLVEALELGLSLLFVTEVSSHLALEDQFLEGVSVDALLLVVAQDSLLLCLTSTLILESYLLYTV